MVKTQLKFPANCSSGIPLMALGVVGISAGFYHQSAPAVALGAAVLVGPLVILALLHRVLRDINVERTAPVAIFEDDEVEVRVRLENGARLPVFFPRVSEIFAPELHAQKDILFADRVSAGETVEKQYTGQCKLPRGIYSIGPSVVSVSDPFGWFEVHKQFRDAARLKVYPRLQNFGVRERIGDCLAHLTTDLTRFGRGESQEFFSVREYCRGDSYRRIHWRLTAKRGFPVVREYSRVAAGDLTVFVDLFRLGLIGVGRSNSLEHVVKIAAAVSAHALARGFRVALRAGNGDRCSVPLAGGSQQIQRILDALVQVKPTGETPLPEILRERAADIKSGTTVLIPVSPYLFGDPEINAHLLSWKRRRIRVLAVVFDAKTFRYIWGHPGGQATAEECVAQFKGAGIEVYLVPCATDLSAVFAGGRG